LFVPLWYDGIGPIVLGMKSVVVSFLFGRAGRRLSVDFLRGS